MVDLTRDRQRIASIDFDQKSSPKSALINFEKAPAAKTALMVSAVCLQVTRIVD